MAKEQLEGFVMRILFKYKSTAQGEGATIAYMYNRESLDELGIKRHDYDKSQFIEVGDIITLGGEQCRVVGINFKLYETMANMEHGYGINMYSSTDPTDHNCQIGVFVEPVK